MSGPTPARPYHRPPEAAPRPRPAKKEPTRPLFSPTTTSTRSALPSAGSGSGEPGADTLMILRGSPAILSRRGCRLAGSACAQGLAHSRKESVPRFRWHRPYGGERRAM